MRRHSEYKILRNMLLHPAISVQNIALNCRPKSLVGIIAGGSLCLQHILVQRVDVLYVVMSKTWVTSGSICPCVLGKKSNCSRCSCVFW